MKRPLQIAAILALTIFLVWLFLHNANLRDVAKIIEKASIPWLILGATVNLTTLLFRTIRWRAIIDPDDPPAFYPTLLANAVGYMLSTVLPFRAADVARPALLSRRTKHRFSAALGTVLTERILDLSSILLLYLYFVGRRWSWFSDDPRTASLWRFLVIPAAIASCVILGLLVFLIAGVFLYSSVLRRFHEWLGKIVPTRFRAAWMNMFDAFVQSLEITRHPASFAKVLFSTVGIWFCLTVQFTCTATSLHIDLPFDSSFFVTGATTVSMAVPTPGGIGGMHKTAQFILVRFYHLAVDPAVAAAVLFHLVGTVPVVILGIAMFMAEGVRWKDVTHA